jgi:hypothetical protein
VGGVKRVRARPIPRRQQPAADAPSEVTGKVAVSAEAPWLRRES